MITRVFVSYSYKYRDSFRDFHMTLGEYFRSKGVGVYSFVFDFVDKLDDQKMMEAALREIDKSDFILVELTNKSVGVGVEAGYAKAKGKKVIYLYKNDSEMQQTVRGISDHVISYNTVDDVISWFDNNWGVI